MNKTTIRSQLLKQRKNLHSNQIITLSEQIVQHISNSKLFKQAEHIALYLPFNGEVDLTALLRHQDKQLYLPSIQGQHMQFHLYRDDILLVTQRYGLKQPKFNESLKSAPLDLCLMPLVGFDMSGNRLGMGGGFYDRYFDSINPNNTQLAGIAYQFQQHDSLPNDSWDVRIKHIFTEQGHIKL